jgi:hypothetical protein
MQALTKYAEDVSNCEAKAVGTRADLYELHGEWAAFALARYATLIVVVA